VKDGKEESAKEPSGIFTGLLHLFIVIADKFGLSGTIVIFVMGFFTYYSSDDQKAYFIDKFLLGIGMSDSWLIFVLSALFLFLLFSQNRIFSRKIIALEKANEVLQAWKDGHQELKMKRRR